LIKWAAAAAILLAAGMSVGRLTSATADAGKLRAAIEPGIRQQLERDFARMLRDGLSESSTTTLAASRDSAKQVFEEYLKAVEAKRAEDYQNFSAALNKLESQRVADYVSLKQDLDTVAVTTDAGLRRTQQQLVRLADYTQPTDNLNSTAK